MTARTTEYMRYTGRRPITQPFQPTDDEHALYEAVSGSLRTGAFLQLASRRS